MTPLVVGLNEVGRSDVTTAGGKGANLGELLGKGFPVPPGFVVTAQACEGFFQELNLAEKIKGLAQVSPEGLEGKTAHLRGLIHEAEMPGELVQAIYAGHDSLVEGRGAGVVCAVRSSATAEDLGEASFAGQHATYYYVSRDKLLRMVKHCWASLFSPEAVAYRNAQAIDHASVYMAVVVQEMIRSEVSGITFTANPVTGNLKEVVTESSWGLGAAIVDGRVTPDHYVFRRPDLSLKEKRIARKRCMVPAEIKPDETGRLRDVPLHLRQIETLSADQARLVAEWAIKAEEHFGSPQDVEWAITGGQFHMLQSRPVTVMGAEEFGRDIDGKYVVFKPIIENFTDPLTPLSQDFYTMAFTPPLFRMIGGRVYVNLTRFRAALPIKITDEEMASLLYLSTEAPHSSLKVSLAKLPICGAMALAAYLFFGVFFARTKNLPDGYMDGYRELCRKVEKENSLGLDQTFDRVFSWSNFFQPAGELVIMLNFTAPRYWFFQGFLKKLLKRWAPNLREDAVSLLSSGAEEVLSAEMGRGVWNLAVLARKTPRVRELLKSSKPDKAYEALAAEPEAREFLEALEDFLKVNGHRGFKELELMSLRWEENPSPVLCMIRNYLLVDSNPANHEIAMGRARTEVKEQLKNALDKRPFERLLGIRRRLIDHLSDRIKYFSKMRENSRFYHIMGFNTVRKRILAVEKELIGQGRLRCPNDIFFLHMNEIDYLRSGELDWLDVESQVRERRLKYVRLSKMAPPKVIGLSLPEKETTEEILVEDPDTLQGQSASPGRYEGVAHVILDPAQDMEIRPGEVLVAPYTDPAWTPLFLTAGAAVVEVGSYLSHAGTVAREYGMPCVVDVAECTRRIHTGIKVSVDGDRGWIKIVEEKGGGGS